MIKQKLLLVVLTRNPGEVFDDWIAALNGLKDKPDSVLVIDSSSTDGTQSKAEAAGFSVVVIDQADFNHGSTRQIAVNSHPECEFIVFMTQDAILSSPDALKNLLRPFDDNAVGAVCGRQLPRVNAGPIEAHARIYNYPEQSSLRTFEDSRTMGVRAAFLSNSFAAYRISALSAVGGFPDDVIFGEDMYVAARLLKAGYKIAYAADACVYHSHSYSIMQEFKRYFDMGVFHVREPWIRQEFGSVAGEGMKFLVSEYNYLFRHAFWKIPEAILRAIFRYAGFRLGLLEPHLPASIKPLFSMNSSYFSKNTPCV